MPSAVARKDGPPFPRTRPNTFLRQLTPHKTALKQILRASEQRHQGFLDEFLPVYLYLLTTTGLIPLFARRAAALASEGVSERLRVASASLSEPGSSPCIRREPPTMTIAYTTDRAVPGASVGGARHAGFGWVVRGKANSTALKQL